MSSYTTPELVASELRASVAFSATSVPSLSEATTWIEEESGQIDHDAGFVFESTAYTDDYDYEEDSIFLKVTPVISVDSLEYNTYNLGTTKYTTGWVSKTEDTDFTLYADKGRIDMLPAFAPAEGKKKFRITYTAGYAVTPAVIQKLATKTVAHRILSSLITQNVNDRNAGGSISVGSINIVEPSDYGVGSYKQLGSDIKELQKKVTSGFGVMRYSGY